MNTYCTYFDHRYLARGLAMIRSLRAEEPGATCWVLCLSEECRAILERMAEPGVRVLPLAEFEAKNPDVLAVKPTRSAIEYYFTCTPALVRTVLDTVGEGESVTYVDGDLFFFGSPAALHAALAAGAVSITPHRFTARLKPLERFGLYNVGWLGARNTAAGRAVIDWWRARCIEWCYDQLSEGRFGDQKYLDSFTTLFPGVVVLDQPGCNLAPWNLARGQLGAQGNRLTVAGSPLVFFHFHGLKVLGGHLYLGRHYAYGAPFDGLVRRGLYRPYVAAVDAVVRELHALGMDPERVALARNKGGAVSRAPRWIARLRQGAKNAWAVLNGQFVLVAGGRIWL